MLGNSWAGKAFGIQNCYKSLKGHYIATADYSNFQKMKGS